MTISVKITGLDGVLRKMDRRELLDKPMRKFFLRACTDMVGRARENAPVDTGQLRNSIDYSIDKDRPPMRAEVGVINARDGSTLLAKAAAMEWGTGRFAESGPDAISRRSAHWPPSEPLELWASRHGFEPVVTQFGVISPGRQVANIIGIRGGLRPRRYLRNALREVVAGRLRQYANQLEDDIRREWDT